MFAVSVRQSVCHAAQLCVVHSCIQPLPSHIGLLLRFVLVFIWPISAYFSLCTRHMAHYSMIRIYAKLRIIIRVSRLAWILLRASIHPSCVHVLLTDTAAAAAIITQR